MKKKILSLLLALALILPLCPAIEFPALSLPVFAATSGTTGDCTWTLDGTVLTISGSGTIGDYTSNAPWGTEVTEVIIEDGVTSIGELAFADCSSLTSVTIPDSVTFIDYCAFGGCSSLTSVTISDSVTSIGDYAFYSCNSLTSVTIPDSVTSIDYYAFYYCTSLTSITLPDSITNIGEGAFADCESLTDVWYSGTEEDRAEISIGDDNEYLTSATWHYAEPETTVIAGDMDQNGMVDLDDALYLLFHINFPEKYPINQPYDFDGDGEEALNDVIYLLYHVNFAYLYPLH